MADFLKDLVVSVQGPVVVNADNQGSIALLKNPVFHDRSKHIDIQYHYARELIRRAGSCSTTSPLIFLPSLCRVFATLPCIEESECFDGLTLFSSFLQARLGSQQGEVLEYISLRRAELCAFLAPSFSTCAPDLYIIKTPLVAFRLSCFPPNTLSCKSPFLVALLYCLCRVSSTLP